MQKLSRLIFFIFLWTLLLFALPAGAQAGEIYHLYVWDADHGIPRDLSVLPNHAIQWYKRNSNYYLFLPAGVDPNNLFVHFT